MIDPSTNIPLLIGGPVIGFTALVFYIIPRFANTTKSIRLIMSMITSMLLVYIIASAFPVLTLPWALVIDFLSKNLLMRWVLWYINAAINIMIKPYDLVVALFQK